MGSSAIFSRMPYLPCPAAPSPVQGALFADGKEPAENPPALYLKRLSERLFPGIFSKILLCRFPLLRDAGADDRPPPAMAWAP